MSKVNMAIMITGVVGVLGLTVAQSLQVRQLEARLADLESSLGGAAAVQTDGTPRASAAGAPAGR